MVLSRFALEVATAVAPAIFGIVIIVGALEFGIGWGDAGPEAGYFPFYVGLLIVLGSIGVAGQALLFHRAPPLPFLDAAQARRVAAFFLPIVLFVTASLFLGLYLATALYLAAVMHVQGGYRLAIALAVGVGTAMLFFVLFELWFQVPLLKGPLEAWLGIA
jgi:hypothetical protein